MNYEHQVIVKDVTGKILTFDNVRSVREEGDRLLVTRLWSDKTDSKNPKKYLVTDTFLLRHIIRYRTFIPQSLPSP